MSKTFKHKAKGKNKNLYYNCYLINYKQRYYRHPDVTDNAVWKQHEINKLLRLDLRQQMKELNETK